MASRYGTKVCIASGCTRIASCNAPDQTKAAYCARHKLPGMDNVVSKRCAQYGCHILGPKFNAPGKTTGLYCVKHKLPGMNDVLSKKCAHVEGCTRQPKFNIPGAKRALYCAKHKTEVMVDVLQRKCAHEGCGRNPFFNAPGETKGLYCVRHKAPEMVNVLTKRCEHEGCLRQPSYNFEGLSGGVRCLKHRLPKMQNVVSQRCEYNGCGVLFPGFNFPGQTKGRYCAKHQEPGMTNVVERQCAHEGCSTKPGFNVPDQTKGLYCTKHKMPGMTSVHGKKCQAAKCKDDAEYGKDEFHRAQFCGAHKPEGYVDVYAERRCEAEGCTADYDLFYDKADEQGAVKHHKVCMAHAPPGYEDAIKRKCKYCDIRDDVPFVCAGCRRSMHKKEYAVVRHLRRTIDVPFKYDESPGFECTRKRPDIRFEMPTHDVIVEVDENQHRGYEESCECARISEIVGAIGGKPVVFVRYNPDTVRYGGKVSAVTAAERIDLLVDTVKYELQNAPTKFSVRLVQLWYDGPVAVSKQEQDITRLVAV